jgi:hypothetical protein
VQILTVWPMGGSRAQSMGVLPEADIFAKIGGWRLMLLCSITLSLCVGNLKIIL